MTTYLVQAILGDNFEDMYITARDGVDAIAQAKTLTILKHRFTRFLI